MSDSDSPTIDITKHTPTPWKLYAEESVTEVQCNEKPAIASWMGFDDCNRSIEGHRANAAFIVTACNAYDANQATIAQQAETIKAMASTIRKVMDQTVYSDENGLDSIASILALENHDLYVEFAKLAKGE